MKDINKNEIFTTMPVGKAVAKLAIPTVISQIIVILYSLADTLFVGQLNDPNQLAALSITFPIFTILTAIANLFGIGANSVIARCLGKNDENTAKKTSSFSFWTSLGITIILSLILVIFMKPILLFFKADEFTFTFSAKYLLWVFVIGGIPTVMALMLGHLVRSVGKTKEAGIGLAIGGIMNIILDPLFIFEKGDKLFNGVFTMPLGFGMDVAGAGLATMISNILSMIYLLIVFAKIRKSSVLTLNPKYFSLEKKVAKDSIAVGFPAAISVLLVSVSIALLNSLLLNYENGNILSAAYGVTSKCGTIALHLSIGVAQGVMPLIGFNYGAKNHKRVHDVCNLSFKILLIFSIVFLIIVQLIPEIIASVFTPHSETIKVSAKFMRCWSWCVIGMSLFNMYNSIFQAVGKWKTSFFLAILRLGIIFSLLAFIFDALFGVNGLMWVQAVTDTLVCLIALFLYNNFKKEIVKKEITNIEKTNIKKENYKIITIGREFGSGGRTIAKSIAKKLNIPCYDSEIIHKISIESGLSEKFVEEKIEQTLTNNLYYNVFSGRTIDGKSLSDELWFAQKKVIFNLASEGPCVIVGRCADYILKEHYNVLSIFIHASKEIRAERIIKTYGENETKILKRIDDKDSKRKAYYELYTGQQWGHKDNYDILLDSGKIGLEKCVKIIEFLYNLN